MLRLIFVYLKLISSKWSNCGILVETPPELVPFLDSALSLLLPEDERKGAQLWIQGVLQALLALGWAYASGRHARMCRVHYVKRCVACFGLGAVLRPPHFLSH